MDYIGTIIIIIGFVLVGNKNYLGWIVQLLGNVLLGIVMYEEKVYGAMILSIIMSGLSIYYFITWYKYNKWNKNKQK